MFDPNVGSLGPESSAPDTIKDLIPPSFADCDRGAFTVTNADKDEEDE